MRIVALSRRFALLSLALILLAGLVIGWLVRQNEIKLLESLIENRNEVMTKVFVNLLSAELNELVSKPVRSPDAPDVLKIRQQIAGIVWDSDIAKLKLYNLQGKVVFSTDPAQFGEDKSNNVGFTSALNGKTYSELGYRKRFSATEGDRFNIDLVSSYIPILRDQKIIAVFELYQEVTPLLDAIEAALLQTMAIVLAVLAGVFALQYFAARHTRKVITAQEKTLETANNSLELWVAERTQALKSSEQRVKELLDEQKLIFDNAQVGILLLKNRTVLKCNQRIADMFGYASPSDIIGKCTALFYADETDFAAVGQSGYAQLAEKGFADLETKMQSKDGNEFWVIQSGRPLNPAAVLESPSIWVYTDITERKLAESELSIAAAAFESQEGMLVIDANKVILRANKAFADMTGYTAEEVIGKTLSILRSDRHDAAFFKAMWASINDTGYWQGEIWDRHKSGEAFPKWLTISAVKNRDGKVTNYVGTYTDITERKLAEEKIRHLAFYDQLTGLPNRSLLMDRLTQAMVASERSRNYGAVLFLDLDNFKALNDTLGHDRGDILLRDVGEALLRNVRQADTVARLGGDEFVIILLELDADADLAASVVEGTALKLLKVLKQDYHLAGMEFHSSASIGATLFVGEGTSIEELLKQSDLAMYKSKEAGRNAFHFFDPTMEAKLLTRNLIEKDLRRAIQEEQFLIHYQPQVEGSSRNIVGAEALIRWQHPQRGLVPPNDFISLAEDCGLIVPIGQWVLEAACRQLAVWAILPAMAHLTISVNVSVHQFNLDNFVEQVIAAIEKAGANPQRLKLELTESLFMQNVEDIICKMSALKAVGVSFSLDDFGTGYSSLAYLSRLPLDQLKIDRSFVMDIETSNNNVVICAATIKLAHSLGMKVVAEGVETEAQRYFLTTVHHCDQLQGYLISRPLPLQDFEVLLG